jgi:hypothetical protein
MVSLIGRERTREENRRVLRILIGVVILLVLVSIATIVLKHRG